MVNRRTGVLAASAAVLTPVVVLALSHGRAVDTGCSAHYASTRLTVTLEQAGSVEVRLGGQAFARRHEAAGTSAIPLSGAGTPTVTEFTDDGQQVPCAVSG